MSVLPADANMTLVAMMLSRRRLTETSDQGASQDTATTHSTAEEVWSTLFLVVIIIMALCLCLVCCSVCAQLVGCGSFLGRVVLSCCPGWCGGGGKKQNKPSTPKRVSLPEARVIGPAPTPVVVDEEQVPLKPKRAVVATKTHTTPKAYNCCGFELPCLAWLSVCGCSFVGCAWLGSCWTCVFGGDGGGEGENRRRRRQASGGELSLVQNVLTCWQCCGLLPMCCPGRSTYTLPPPPPPRKTEDVAVAKPVPITVVRGTPVEEDDEKSETSVVDPRPMPGLFFA